MKKKEPLRNIKNLSSSDYINLFLAKSWKGSHRILTDVQAYDYKMICEGMQVPTTIFRPDYNYVLLLEEGHITMRLGTETKRIYAPAAVFVGAGQIVSVVDLSEHIGGTIVILENQSLHRIFTEMELLKILQMSPIIPLAQTDRDIFSGIAFLILKEYDASTCEPKVLISLVQALLHKLVKHSGVDDLRSRTHLIAVQFKTLVYKKFATEKNISFYTDTLEISENYLNRCTQLIFGKAAKRYF